MFTVYKRQQYYNKNRTRWKIYLCAQCAGCGFENFETIDKEELSYLLKVSKIYKTILPYCLKYRKNRKNPKIVNLKKWRTMLSSKCAVCDRKKFIKEQEA